ncbi:MAG TPA: hypothetical protein VKU85_18590 [bacterium]|nr:hypothetical protein [bacterium]
MIGRPHLLIGFVSSLRAGWFALAFSLRVGRFALVSFLCVGGLALAAAPEPAVGDPVAVELDDGKVIRGTLHRAEPDHVTIDRGGPKGPFHDPLVRIERDRIVSFGEPEAESSGRPRWVHLGYGGGSLGGRAFHVTFESARNERSSWRILATYASNGWPGAEPVPLAAGPGHAVAREVAVSLGPALGRRSGGGRATVGWWLGAAAVGGELADQRAFLTGGLVLGTELFLAPTRAIGVGIRNEVNLNPEIPFTAVFLTLRFHNGG